MRLGDLAHDERFNSVRTLTKDTKSLRFNMGGKMDRTELTTSVGDYRDVEIPSNSVIYVDPPYRNTGGYGMAFDHEFFYDWCEKQTELVVISEYWMPEDRFVCIASFKRTSTFSATNNSKAEIEKLFVPKGQYEMYKKLSGKLF